jgi:OOP family OmpA-OmpF porin
MNRRTLPRRRTALITGLVVTAAMLVGGCSGDPFAPEQTGLVCPAVAGGPVTLVLGARANSSPPALPAEIVALVREASKRGSRIRIVALDGAPFEALSASFISSAGNDIARGRELDLFIQSLQVQVEALRAKTPEADVLAALDEAARLTPEGGTVVLIDSGLQTGGQLDFTKAGAFDVDPRDVNGYLRLKNQLPILTGRAVVFAGLERV